METITKIKRIVIEPNQDVYDITVIDNHNFFANGILVHNCVEIGMYAKTKDGRSGFQFCLTGDTKLLTIDGYKTIDNLKNEKNVKLVSVYNSDKDTIKSKTSFACYDSVLHSTGIKPVFEIKLKSGQAVKATENHKFLTQEGYVDVKDLDVNRHRLYLAQDNNNSLEESALRKGFNEYDWLGWALGDGYCFQKTYKGYKEHLTKNTVLGLVFGSKDDHFAKKQLVPIFETIIADATLNTETYRKTKEDASNYIDKVGVEAVTVYSARAEYIINKYGLVFGTAKDKKLPKLYWSSSKENKARVISALFSTDGSVVYNAKNKHEAIQLSLSSPSFAKDVQLALTEFGIVSRITISERKHSTKCNTEVILYIANSIDIHNFTRYIGFNLHPAKQQKLNVLPLVNKQHKNGFKIESKKYIGEEEVFDVSVEKTHNFVANGIITHNCNLTEINGRFCDVEEKFYQACRASAIIGTMQAGYTDFKYVGSATKEITEEEALLGCSITGIMDNPKVFLDPEIQRKGAREIKKTNEKIAKFIGIKSAARTTCVKPAGTTSCVLGTASGVHPHHALRYMRRVQVNRNEFPGQLYKLTNPEAVEKSVWSDGGTDEVITFLCEVPRGSIVKNQFSAVELLEKIKLIQQNWVEAGTNKERCMHPGVRHNVSNTITVKPDEWDEVRDYLYRNRHWFAGISLLPASGDLDYAQAPLCTILNAKEIAETYGDAAILASGLIVAGLDAFEDNLWEACNAVLYHNSNYNDIGEEKKKDFVRRGVQFANRYFEGDLKKMAYCLKHVWLWKKWLDIKRTHNAIDWDKVQEVNETFMHADTLAAQACSGGVCQL